MVSVPVLKPVIVAVLDRLPAVLVTPSLKVFLPPSAVMTLTPFPVMNLFPPEINVSIVVVEAPLPRLPSNITPPRAKLASVCEPAPAIIVVLLPMPNMTSLLPPPTSVVARSGLLAMMAPPPEPDLKYPAASTSMSPTAVPPSTLRTPLPEEKARMAWAPPLTTPEPPLATTQSSGWNAPGTAPLDPDALTVVATELLPSSQTTSCSRPLMVVIPPTVPSPLALTVLLSRSTVFWSSPLFTTCSWLPNAPWVTDPSILTTPGTKSRGNVLEPVEPSMVSFSTNDGTNSKPGSLSGAPA